MNANLIKFIIAIVVAVVIWNVRGPRNSGSRQAAKLQALPTYTHDFTTPEGAIHCLEDAYRKHDLEAAVAAKDFTAEARLMLKKIKGAEKMADDAEVLKQTAETLELSFRAHMKKDWPDFSGIESYFTERTPQSAGVVLVTEVCRFPDGGYSEQHLLVAETPKGWRVLNPVDK